MVTPEDKGKIHICKKRVQNVKNDLGVPQITPPQTRKRVKKARKEYKMKKSKKKKCFYELDRLITGMGLTLN